MLQRRWLFTLLVLAAPLVPAFGQDAPVTLKWKFEKDKPFFQKMTTETVQNMKVMGNDVKQTQKQTFYFSWTPKEEKDGNWTILQKIEGVVMDIDISGNKISYDSTKDNNAANPLADFFKALVGTEFSLTLDKDFKVTKIEGRDKFLDKLIKANPQMEGLLKQILSEDSLKEMADPTFGALPNKEVKKGDAWERSSKLSMGPIGTYETKSKYTYEGKEGKLDKIKVETTLTYTAPAAGAAGGGLPFTISKADLKTKNAGGTILVDAEKGRIEKSDLNVELEGSLEIAIGGMTTTVELKQTQKTAVETTNDSPLKKAEPAK